MEFFGFIKQFDANFNDRAGEKECKISRMLCNYEHQGHEGFTKFVMNQ